MTELEDCIGKLTGYRCPDCGCCLYINNIDNVWCSNCNFRTFQQDHPLSALAFVPVPDNHPHIGLFDNLQVINDPLPFTAENGDCTFMENGDLR